MCHTCLRHKPFLKENMFTSIFFQPFYLFVSCLWALSGGSVIKNFPASERDMGSITGWGRSRGEGNGNPFQYSCLGNHMDRGTWWATVHGVTKCQTWFITTNNSLLFMWVWICISICVCVCAVVCIFIFHIKTSLKSGNIWLLNYFITNMKSESEHNSDHTSDS